ncbi:MAG: ferrochelatase [Pseudomonadota bacterium]|nr:ferrochelatase [Pseudomonadota bacterium]
MSGEGAKIAVVLFNLGGPDGPADVRPFLENLFSDPAIIGAPSMIRRPLAALIARLRARSAIANYAVMGGGSPLLGHTRAQADALETTLAARMPGAQVRTFIAMRYWKPATEDAAAEVARFCPDEIVLVPLYPQFSTTTTASSLAAWRKAYAGPGTSRAICCWYGNAGLIEAHAARISETWEAAGRPKVRLLFSAHGLPQKIASSGDPYKWQVEATCANVVARLGAGWDWQICYQSRVGPMKWLGPSTPEAIAAAGSEGLGVLVDPIAFVSEHIETLVELDRDYAALARAAHAPVYLRAPAVGTHLAFIDGLADAVRVALARSGSSPDGEPCSAALGRCGRSAGAVR